MPTLRARRPDGAKTRARGGAGRKTGPRRTGRASAVLAFLTRRAPRLRAGALAGSAWAGLAFLLRRAPRGRGVVRGAALAVLAAAGLAAWSGGAAERGLASLAAGIVEAGARAGLAVDEVFVEGRRRAPLEDLRAGLGVARGDPMLGIDPAEIRARIESNAWIASASVERRFPDVLYIRVVERRPMALWQHRGEMGVVDAQGRILTRRGAANFAALPLIVGAGAPGAFPALLAAMAAAPALYPRLSSASWVGERRWTLRFDDRVDVLLPEGPAAAAWERLDALQKRTGILDARLERIDLRGTDRVLVRPEAAAELAESRT